MPDEPKTNNPAKLTDLLKPLSCLTPEEIDDNFVCCDTDSLFIKSRVRHKVVSSFGFNTPVKIECL